MDATEKLVQQHLAHRGFENVVFEPDGNVPPDFVIDGTIAVEVRRLNQNHGDGFQTKGLEEEAVPLLAKVSNLLKRLGPPTAAESWFVTFQFSRPVEHWKTLGKKITHALQEFEQRPVRETGTILIDGAFELDVIRATKLHASKYLVGGYTDGQSGGLVLAEMQANIAYCAAEKAQKITRFRYRYPQWWLALVDHIGNGLDEADKENFQRHMTITHGWDKVLLIDPKDVTNYLEIESSTNVMCC